MNILAVIPACEGSVIFPNKNIRIVNGKPLIYYVINNARQSKYITDIIVTTNSKEIINIARQMGVKTKLRSDTLCNTEVSLDKVVYDIFDIVDIEKYDYIVTMQSISPTLKSNTLDKAIEECIKCNYDTSISVTPIHKFYWDKCDDNYIPLRKERVNRSKLPPLYSETGAFLITKTRFVNENNRIGNKIKLYELDADEAVDVYCFGDLKQVESILCRKKIAIYVNGNNEIGLGHIYRVIQLADELFSKPDIYFDKNITKIEVFGKTTHNLIPVDGKESLYIQLAVNGYDIVINDILSTNIEYMKKLKAILPEAKIVNFEDEGSGAELADIVFNALYEDEYANNIRAGEKYFIASKLFLLYEPIAINEKVNNVFISFGGADPQNYTDRLLNIITQEKYDKIKFHVVIGKAKKNIDALLSFNGYNNISVLYNIDGIADVMNKCDIAITSRGRTGFELAFLGIPMISIAQHDREALHTFLGEQNGICYLGVNPDDCIIQKKLDEYINMSKAERSMLQKKMLCKDLRNGRKNVMKEIFNL